MPDETWFKVWGTGAEDVWLIGDRGSMAHFDGSWTVERLENNPRLITLHGASASDRLVVGGAGRFVLLESDGGPWTAADIDGLPALNGAFVAADGQAAVAGNQGAVAERRDVSIGLECHAQYSKTPEGLDRIYHLVDSPAIGINLDTGNAYLAGQDVYAWLERVADRLVHLHAKDISVEHSDAERGKVTGTAVGCACGDGVIDWPRVIDIVRSGCPRDIVFSVECGTPDQAARSLEYLKSVV